MEQEPGYIYLVQSEGTSYYKIGLTTKTVEERVQALNTEQSPHPNVLIHSIWVSDVRTAEKHFHQQCSAYHHRREWFKFSDDEVRQLVNLMNEYQQQYVSEPTYYSHQDSDLPDWAAIHYPHLS